MKLNYDVIVVGAGPGGSTAARYCAKFGLNTLIIEKEHFPRYKPCGGCLSIKTLRLLGFNLNPVVENKIYGAKFSYCLEDPFFIQFKEPIAFMVMRDRFDQFLAKKAIDEGVEILGGERVSGVRQKDDGVEAELASGNRLSCGYLIGADGPESIVARSLTLSALNRNGNGVAVESEIPFESAIDFPKEDLHLIHLDFGQIPNGYGWVFPKKECLSIGIGGMFRETKKMNPRRYFNAFLKGLDYIPEGKTGKIIGHLLPPFYDEGQRVSQGRCLLVGDAAHLMDPVQGEGIYYAIQSGMLAAEAIIQSKETVISPSDLYQNAVRSQIFENLKWALYFSRFVFRFTKLAYRILKHYPELGEFYLRVLEGKETYQGFVAKVKDRMNDLLGGRLSEKIRKAISKT